jgi:hypothetical protein
VLTERDGHETTPKEEHGMTERILGEAGPKRKRRFRFIFLPILLAAALALMLAGAAKAVHDAQFQLDGDTTATAYSPPPGSNPAFDWDSIFNVSQSAGTETVSNNSANVGTGKTFDAASFTRDFETNATCPTTSLIGLNSTSTNFCTGDDTTYATGSKDTLGIGNGGWQCNHDNNVNSKIDIMNAYVAQYTAANGHKIFYFGVERNVSNGTNDVGVWFLQTGASCTAPSGSVNFTGEHQDGDTLVVAEQTSGGGVSTAKAFRWAANAAFPGDKGCIDSNDNPNPAVVVNGTKGCNNLPIATGADCKTTGAGDALCATTNAFCEPPRRGTTTPPCTLPWNSDVTTQWLTANGSSVDHTIVSPDFFEGGIDITAAFSGHPGTTPSCFTTSVPDTRSSASPTATLFDFTINQIGGCQSGLTTQENATASREIGANGTISSGTDTATLTISGTPVWDGTLSFYLCGPNVTSCDANGFLVTSTAVHSTDASHAYTSGTATLTSAAGTGKYCWHAHFEPDDASKAAGVDPADDNGTNECFIITPKTPTLTTAATCSATPCLLGSTLNDSATLTGTARNPDPLNPGSNTTYPTINGGTKAADSSITWALYGPGAGGAAQCTTAISGAPTPSSIAVSGDNTYGPVSYATTHAGDTVGTYTFAASYPGDGPNTNAATAVACDITGANGEQVTVTGSLSSSSKQGWLPNDRITLTSTPGTTFTGTVTATLYKGSFTGTLANCGAGSAVQQLAPQTLNVSSGATNTATVSTTNTTFFIGTNPSTGAAGGTDGDYFWLIHTSISGLTNPADRCESATITHNDG